MANDVWTRSIYTFVPNSLLSLLIIPCCTSAVLNSVLCCCALAVVCSCFVFYMTVTMTVWGCIIVTQQTDTHTHIQEATANTPWNNNSNTTTSATNPKSIEKEQKRSTHTITHAECHSVFISYGWQNVRSTLYCVLSIKVLLSIWAHTKRRQRESENKTTERIIICK